MLWKGTQVCEMESVAGFVPLGPAESPSIRAFAESSLTSMPPANLRDKAKYMQWMERLTDHMLGKDEARKQREAAKLRSSIQMPSSSSGAVASASASASCDSANMGMDMNTITADMKIASLSSLDKIRKLRNSVTAFNLCPTDAQYSVEAGDQVRSGGKSVDWADQHPQARSATELKTSVTSSINDAIRISTENIPENVDITSSSIDASATEEGKVDLDDKISNTLAQKSKSLPEVGASGVSKSNEDETTSIDHFDIASGIHEVNQKNLESTKSEGDGSVGAHEIVKKMDAATTLYEPRFNDKGELDFSGSWRAPEESRIGAVQQTTMKGAADHPTSSVSISDSSNVKKSLDLSGLSLDELKDLQGHY